jgi:hypothetical protein
MRVTATAMPARRPSDIETARGFRVIGKRFSNVNGDTLYR